MHLSIHFARYYIDMQWCPRCVVDGLKCRNGVDNVIIGLLTGNKQFMDIVTELIRFWLDLLGYHIIIEPQRPF